MHSAAVPTAPATAPICPACTAPTRLTDGAEVYPHRPDLAAKAIWKCDGCGAYVGCHPGTNEPLGTPAGPELRYARRQLHENRVDPLWRTAWREPCYAGDDLRKTSRDKRRPGQKRKDITRRARSRVYEFLADRLSLTRDECHTGLFDIEACRRAWVALTGVTYADIRAWAHEQRAAGQATAAAREVESADA